MLTFTAGRRAAPTAIAESDNPLPAAIDAAKGDGTWVGDFVNYVGLAGLVASFFSIIFAYSRQLFALSRAGYLPRVAVGDRSSRKTPYRRADRPGDRSASCSPRSPRTGRTMINIAVFGATVSYVLMMLAHIVLRSREPDLERPYRTPGGTRDHRASRWSSPARRWWRRSSST